MEENSSEAALSAPPPPAAVALLATTNCPSCAEAERLWREVCEEYGLALEYVSADEAEGLALIERLDIQCLPVLLIDGSPSVIGVPTAAVAREVLDPLHVRKPL